MKFADLGLIDPILQAAADIGYEEPSPIQAQAITPVLEGKDLIGCAQTGTGKTAAFAMPILQRLSMEEAPGWCPTRALILTPTRELALQICESFEAYGKYMKLKVTVVFGGVPQRPQEVALRHGVDILVATPGRLLDLVGQQLVDLQEIKEFVLDEADRMLDMGFLPDVRRVIGLLPKERQTLLFSATMPSEIATLAQTILRDPVRVAVDPVSSTVDKIDQQIYFVAKENKRALLASLLRGGRIKNALVFVRTKHGADKVARDLTRDGIRADSIHGDKTQNARQYALSSFKEGQIRVLVATDIAARGIDIDALPYVINYDLPSPAESYVHRIGRTGRAGHEGTAISFCDGGEYPYLLDIEKLIGKRIPVVEEHPFALEPPTTGKKGQKLRPADRPKAQSIAAAPQTKGQNAAGAVQPKAQAASSERTKTETSDKPRSQPKNEAVPAERPIRQERPAKPERPARAERPAKPERPARQERTASPDRPVRQERTARNERSANRGLTSIRDVNVQSPPKETVLVDTNDQLPRPEPGHLLLNSFADTGIDYRMTENPNADNEAIESLGFYNPPAGALQAIFGDEYDGNNIDFTIRTEPAPAAAEESGEGKRSRRRRKPRAEDSTLSEDVSPDSDAAEISASEVKSPTRPKPRPEDVDGTSPAEEASGSESEDNTSEGEQKRRRRRRPRKRHPAAGAQEPETGVSERSEEGDGPQQSGQPKANRQKPGKPRTDKSKSDKPKTDKPKGERPPRPKREQADKPQSQSGSEEGVRTVAAQGEGQHRRRSHHRSRRPRTEAAGESGGNGGSEIKTRDSQQFYNN